MVVDEVWLGEQFIRLVNEHWLNIPAYPNGEQGCACGARMFNHRRHVGMVQANFVAQAVSDNTLGKQQAGVT